MMDISRMYCRVDSEHFDEFVKLVGELFGDSNADDVRRWYRYDNCDAVSAKDYVGDHSYYVEKGYTEFTGSWTIYNNTKPLSGLTDSQAAELFNYYRKGGEIECFLNGLNGESWTTLDPVWDIESKYRARQKSECELFVEAALNAANKYDAECDETFAEAMFKAGFKAPKGVSDV